MLFRERIREKIADGALQAALDANAERRIQARVNAWNALPDWRERRQRAHIIRAEVIQHLEQYLAEFTGRATANGIQVHRARDAAEAIRLVLEITDAAQGTLIAKSKSMLSEEIGLNHAFEAAGKRVVETDLGEYIVQLRGEPPAHIITPAVHLRRGQVGQLFHEKLGIPFTEDIPTLAQAARAALREIFLRADIGLTGVNFGIAETGGLVLVTNEGNGRMCATLPRVHIALMGMERLLPGLDDLALCLSLLPRSATGQKLSVYTQIIHAPETGQQRHLVVVDNGRLALRDSALKEALYCIRCGACLNACPVFREIGGHGYVGYDGARAPYPGPIGAVISPGLLGENFSELAQASTLCGACKEACPVDIDLPGLLLRVRAGQLPAHESTGNVPSAGGALKPGLAGYSRLAGHPRLFTAAQKLAGLAGRGLPDFIRLPEVTGWGLSKDLPKPAARPFRERFSGIRQQIPGAEVAPNLPNTPHAVSPSLDASGEVKLLSASDLTARFTRELEALGGRVYQVREAELAASLLEFLRKRNIRKIEKWETVPGLAGAELERSGIEICLPGGQQAQAGFTGALAGIAETGTLVIPGGAGKSLTASLVPPIHVAVLRGEAILPSLEAALRLPDVSCAPAAVLVSGPSRTADIEMTLTIGMHGPGELHVFLVDGMGGK